MQGRYFYARSSPGSDKADYMFRERVRVFFSRKGYIRFISHLDLMRAFERALRRSGLPLRMTGGFNPRPRISFPLALAVGWEAEREVMEFELDLWVPPDEAGRRLQEQMPNGLEILESNLVKGADSAQVAEAEYRVEPFDDELTERLTESAVEDFLARETFEVERIRKKKLKSVDIRQYVRAMRLKDGTLYVTMSVSPSGTTRPEEVLLGLGFDKNEIAGGFKVVRIGVKLKN